MATCVTCGNEYPRTFQVVMDGTSYTFDSFENRLRGYPSASLRFDRGALLRSVATWAPGRLRVDGFFDYAAVRDPGLGPAVKSFPGVGAAVEIPLPATGSRRATRMGLKGRTW